MWGNSNSAVANKNINHNNHFGKKMDITYKNDNAQTLWPSYLALKYIYLRATFAYVTF